jgi:hypothetical protein
MGDHNYLPFSFIDELGLQDSFEEFIIQTILPEAYQVGYDDGVFGNPCDERYRTIPKLFNHYEKGFVAGRSGE